MSQPAKNPYLITAPTDDTRCYELAVELLHMRAAKRYRLRPWLKITANCQTEEVTCAAGIRAEPFVVEDTEC